MKEMNEVPHNLNRHLTRRDALKEGFGKSLSMLGTLSAGYGGINYAISHAGASELDIKEDLAEGKTRDEIVLEHERLNSNFREKG